MIHINGGSIAYAPNGNSSTTIYGGTVATDVHPDFAQDGSPPPTTTSASSISTTAADEIESTIATHTDTGSWTSARRRVSPLSRRFAWTRVRARG